MSKRSHESPQHRHRRDTPRLARVWLATQLLALAMMAIAAAAAASGATTVTTTLSGEGREGETIAVLEAAGVKDHATLKGTSGKPSGQVKYALYSDKGCKTLVAKAGEVTVSGSNVPASNSEKIMKVGTYYWQAGYKGDEVNQAGTSACGSEVETVKANIASTSLSTTLSGESKEGETITVLEGGAITDTATLSGTNAGSASGMVTYDVYSDSACKTLVAEAGEETVSSGKVPASNEVKLEGGASYYWRATYKGDALNEGSKSTCGAEIASVKAATSLSTSLSGEGQSGGEIEVQPEALVHDTATLTGDNASSATGTVTYKAYADSACTKLLFEAGVVSVSGGVVPPSSEESLSKGTYYWQASYSGDSLHQASTSTCGSEIASVKEATQLTTLLSGEDLSAEQLEVGKGESVSDDATLNGIDAPMATGTVKYNVYSDSACKELIAEAGKVSVTAGMVPASNGEKLAGGTYYWQAVYSGDSSNLGSTSGCGSEIAVVQTKGWLTTSLSGAGAGEANTEVLESLEVDKGTGVTDTATLHGENPSTATGTVAYSVYSDAECKELVTAAGKVTVSSGKVPASSEEKLAAGTYYWQAVYSGDSNHASTTSGCGIEILAVKESTSLGTSLAGEGQTGASITVTEGAEISDQAKLSGSTASTAEGNVAYNAYSDNQCKTLAALGGVVKIAGSAIPSSEPVSLPAGTYYWQAAYSGSGENAPSVSTCGAEISVFKSATTVSTSLSSGEQSGSTIEVATEAAIMDNATLSGPTTSKASGKVKYKIYSDSECKTLTREAGEVTVTDGVAPASSQEKLSPGTYYWQASYSGDGENASSTSACGSEIAVVASTALTTSLSGAEQSGAKIEALEGNTIVDHATLSGANASKATGQVKYAIYSDNGCKALVANEGEVTVSKGVVPASVQAKLATGTYYWQASYSGDANNAFATSLCGTEEAIVKPEPEPNLEEVAFFGGQEVELDRPVEVIEGRVVNLTAFMGIANYPTAGQNRVQWKRARGTRRAKNWPIVYVAGEAMTGEAKFEPDALTKALVAQNKLESARILGTAKVFGKMLKFESKTFTNAQLKAQMANGGITTESVTSQALPAEAGYQKLTIRWQWIPRINGVNQPAIMLGTSTHNLYICWRAPTPANTPIVFTILDIAGRGAISTARAPTATEAATITQVEAGFKNVQVPETQLTTPQRTYEPKNGTIGEGPLMRYWREGIALPVERTLEATFNAIPDLFVAINVAPTGNAATIGQILKALLERDEGECGTWVEALVAALRSEGIAAQKVMITPTVAAVGPVPQILVNHWRFSAASPNVNTTAQVTREAGAPGQGRANPWAFFQNHVITLVESRQANNNRELFDPSYGSGPIVYTSAANAAAVPDTQLKEYQTANVAGFCSLRPGGMDFNAFQCKEATATTMLSLAFTLLPPGLG
jgi:hypothetical protein